MCTYSMVADHYRDKWQDRPWYPGSIGQPLPGTLPYAQPPIVINQPAISREEFDKLREEVAELKALLKRAKEYDERNGEPDCEMEEKVAILRKVAEIVGVDLNDVAPKA